MHQHRVFQSVFGTGPQVEKKDLFDLVTGPYRVYEAVSVVGFTAYGSGFEFSNSHDASIYDAFVCVDPYRNNIIAPQM